MNSLYIYDAIDPDFGISAVQIKDKLHEIGDADQIDIFINSPGGGVFEGMAIYSQLNRFKGKKVVHIDGLAASIASVIAMVGDEIVMSKHALLMVHRASALVMGTASDMMEMVAVLEKVEDGIISVYNEKTKLGVHSIKSLMEDETWMNAEEALAYGFITKIEHKEVKPLKNHACMKNFKHIPGDLKMLVEDNLDANESVEVQDANESNEVQDVSSESINISVSTSTDDLNILAKSDHVVQSIELAIHADPAYIAEKCYIAGFPQIAKNLITKKVSDEELENELTKAKLIGSACKLAGLTDKTDYFIESGKSLTEIRSELFEFIANSSAQEISSNISVKTSTLPLDDACRSEWQINPELRAEFLDSFDRYLAYTKASTNNQIHIFKK